MYKIAILGCENSHADAFLDSIINKKRYDDVEVVGVYSEEEDALARMREKFGVYCASSYYEFVGKVDGIMITARDGRNHYKYAKPYIPYGIPMFIDKPITSDTDEAVSFMRELKSHGCRVTGGSTCVHAPLVDELSKIPHSEIIGGFLRAPVSMVNNYGGFYFYAQHLCEVMMKIFGYYPKSVRAYVNSNVFTLTVRYGEYDVVAEYVDGHYTYAAYVSCKNEVVGGTYPVTEELYPRELDSFHGLLQGKAGKADLREFIAPVFFMAAALEAIQTGAEVGVKEIDEI